MAEPEAPQDVGWSALRDRPPDAELLSLLESRSLDSLDAGELVDVLAATKRLAVRCEALGLAAADQLRTVLAAMDPQAESDRNLDPTTVAAAEAAAAWCETRYRASAQLHLVRSLTTELPQVWALVRAGRLDVYSASQILDLLASVTDRTLIPELEDQIVRRLLATTASDASRASGFGLVGTNPTRTRALVRRLVARAEPERTDEDFKRAYARRRVVTDAGDSAEAAGMGTLWLTHSVDRIRAIHHRLGLVARSLPAEDPRSMDQQVADLACDILEGRLAVDTCTSLLEEGAPAAIRPTGLRRRIQINVTVPIQTLMGLRDDPGETLTGEIVPASLARRLAVDPDSVWHRMLTDQGRCVELSTEAYTPTTAQKRTIIARDRTCVGVGCNHAADTCDIDHGRAWAAGGETRETNLGSLCRSHHRSKDGGGPFHLRQPRPGTFHWTFPSGHTYTTTADPHPEGSWIDVPEWGLPAGPNDVRAGLRLLDAARRRQAARELWAGPRRDIADRRLQQWRRETGEAYEEPDDAGTDDHLHIPVEMLESWAA